MLASLLCFSWTVSYVIGVRIPNMSSAPSWKGFVASQLRYSVLAFIVAVLLTITVSILSPSASCNKREQRRKEVRAASTW